MRALRAMRLNTVIDIGANRGQFALAARRFFPEAMIYSFEPLVNPADRFRGVFANDPNVCLRQAAVGQEQGLARMHLSAKDDSSSLLPITHRQSTIFPGTAEIGQTQVEIAPLRELLGDALIRPPALLKLDVQGYELQSLTGCEDVIPECEWVYVECSFVELYEGQAMAGEVMAWLRERAFGVDGVYNMVYDDEGRTIQGDFLFRQNAGSGGRELIGELRGRMGDGR